MNVGILGFKSNGPDGFKNWLEEVAFGLRFLLSSEIPSFIFYREVVGPSHATGLKSLQDCKTTLLLVQTDHAASASSRTWQVWTCKKNSWC